jgi:hypothetical protein
MYDAATAENRRSAGPYRRILAWGGEPEILCSATARGEHQDSAPTHDKMSKDEHERLVLRVSGMVAFVAACDLVPGQEVSNKGFGPASRASPG